MRLDWYIDCSINRLCWIVIWNMIQKKNRWFLIDNLVNKRVRDGFVPLIVPLYIKIYVDMVKGECWIGYWWFLVIWDDLEWKISVKNFLVRKSFIRQSAAGRLKSKNICKIAPLPPCFKDLIFSMWKTVIFSHSIYINTPYYST